MGEGGIEATACAAMNFSTSILDAIFYRGHIPKSD